MAGQQLSAADTLRADAVVREIELGGSSYGKIDESSIQKELAGIPAGEQLAILKSVAQRTLDDFNQGKVFGVTDPAYQDNNYLTITGPDSHPIIGFVQEAPLTNG